TWPPDGLRVDAHLYNRGAWDSGGAGAWQWRGVQTRAAILPERNGDGDRACRSLRWARRFLPASGAGIHPRLDGRLHLGVRILRMLCVALLARPLFCFCPTLQTVGNRILCLGISGSLPVCRIVCTSLNGSVSGCPIITGGF